MRLLSKLIGAVYRSLGVDIRVLLMGFAVVLGLQACGAGLQVRTDYSIELTRCILNERSIVDRAGSTREQDELDMAAERERCNAALASIEHGGE